VGRKCRPSGEVRRLDASRWIRCGSRYTPERLRLSKLCSDDDELSIVRVVVSYFSCLVLVVDCSICFVMFKLSYCSISDDTNNLLSEFLIDSSRE
jgi:hypothetical protein